MKTKLIYLAFLLLASASFGCEIRWHNSLGAAKAESAKSKKPVMVFVSSTACPYCTVMSESTFEDESVCKAVMSRFVPLIALDGSADVPKNSKVVGVPTLLFVDAKESEVAQKIVGFRAGDDFLNDIQQRFGKAKK